MKTTSQEFGKYSEDLATSYLQDKGFIILARNYRYKRAEIDIIAQKDMCLYFVEVKARKNVNFGYPEEAVKTYKQKLLKQAAEDFIVKHNWDYQIRFDIIAIIQEKNTIDLVHFEDAFY